MFFGVNLVSFVVFGQAIGIWAVGAEPPPPPPPALAVNVGGPYVGATGSSIQFAGSASGGVQPYTWSWNFGDASTSALQSPLKAYAITGTFTVTLTVIDHVGASVSASTTATVSATPVVLSANAGGPYTGTVGIAVLFAGSASGGTLPYSWSWNFGDGTTSTEQSVQKTYAAAGTYTVTLTVTDAVPNSAADTAAATISVAPVSTFSDDFETNDFSAWTAVENTLGTTVITSTVYHAGTRAAHFTTQNSSAAANARVARDISSSSEIYASAWFNIVQGLPAGAPANERFYLIRFENSSATYIGLLGIRRTGGVDRFAWIGASGSAFQSVVYGGIVPPGSAGEPWIKVGLYIKISATGVMASYVNGIKDIEITGDTLAFGNIARLSFGITSKSATSYAYPVSLVVDDVAVYPYLPTGAALAIYDYGMPIGSMLISPLWFAALGIGAVLIAIDRKKTRGS